MSTYLIVEDDSLHRGFLRDVIESADVNCTRLVEADDGEAAIRYAREFDLQGIVMDLQMPNVTGVQAARAIWTERPNLPILFWSNYADEAYVRGITKIVPRATAYGYLLKTSSKERLRRSMQCVFLEGQNIVDREVRGLQERGDQSKERLTDTEYEALIDIAIGLTDQAIAQRRGISIRSVQGRLQQLYAKMGLAESDSLSGGAAMYNSRTRSVAIAMVHGLINPRAIKLADDEHRRWEGESSRPRSSR